MGIFDQKGYEIALNTLSNMMHNAFKRKIEIDSREYKYQYNYFLNHNIIKYKEFKKEKYFLMHLYHKKIYLADINSIIFSNNYEEKIKFILNSFPTHDTYNISTLNTQICIEDYGMNITPAGMAILNIELAKLYYLEIIQYYLDLYLKTNAINQFLYSNISQCIHFLCFDISLRLFGNIISSFETEALMMFGNQNTSDISNDMSALEYVNNSIYSLFVDDLLGALFLNYYGGNLNNNDESSIQDCDAFENYYEDMNALFWEFTQ